MTHFRTLLSMPTILILLESLQLHFADCSSPERDVQALMAVKRAVTSDPKNVLSDWNPNSPTACNFTGVTCSRRHPGRVAKLILTEDNLRGTIAPEIANISFLWFLNLSTNSFSGSIPAELGPSRRLKWLCLPENNLTGRIPAEIANISSLTALDLSENSLSGGIPRAFGRHPRLAYIYLYRNFRLGGELPADIGKLKTLIALGISENRFQGTIPRSICNCTNLRQLLASSNRFSGTLPDCIGSLWRLVELSFGRNFLSGGIVPGLMNCSELQVLELSINRLSGKVPTDLGNRLRKLYFLSLFENDLSGTIPESLANISGLQILMLKTNSLRGRIPLSLGRLPLLNFINLGENPFEAELEDEEIPVLKALSNCSRLNNLQLYSNNLRGRLPADLGKLRKTLEYLILDDNSISGAVPDALGNLSSMLLLSLSGNLLGGRIPPSMAGLQGLQSLSLSRNRFVGNIPREFVLMNRRLTYLYLDHNLLSGAIPPFLQNLQNLREISLAGNSFSGLIPAELGNCRLLEHLDLSANNLTGEIPGQVAGLEHIHGCFNLSKNSLFGPVPADIGRLQMAECIDLSGNNLSGNITFEMINWLSLTTLNLSSNLFTGTLPDSIGNKLTILEAVDLSANSFSGAVPESLANLSALRFLNLSDNNFSGPVPCFGSFKTLKKSSFLSNPALCGSCLGLAPCPENRTTAHSSGHRNPQRAVIIIGSVVGSVVGITSIFLTFCAVSAWRRTQESRTLLPTGGILEKKTFVTISEEELRRATDDFSESKLLGEGSYASVYRAELQGHLQTVAVKIFREESGRVTAKSERSFLRECKTLGQVRHRNLVKIITVCSTKYFKALVLEFMPNGTLDALLHLQRPDCGRLAGLSIQQRLIILQELGSAVCYLHHHCTPPVLHCDIKPQNVLLDANMTVKLSDFGLSRLLGHSPRGISSSSIVKGTVGYVAPEYGVGSEASMKGDVYSFGILVLETLTRRRPTDPMFYGNLSLGSWVSNALASNQEDNQEDYRQRMVEMVAREDEDVEEMRIESDNEIKILEGLAKLGVSCSNHNVDVRPTMIQVQRVLASLSNIKSN